MNPASTDSRYSRFRKYYTALEPSWQKPKNRIYTAIIFSFLAISLFGWYAIKPTVQTILYLRREITDKTLVNERMEQKITDLINARAELDRIGPQLHVLREAIPQDAEAVDIALQLRNIIGGTEATLSSLAVSSVPVRKETARNGAAKVQETDFLVDTLLTGGYASLERILARLGR